MVSTDVLGMASTDVLGMASTDVLGMASTDVLGMASTDVLGMASTDVGERWAMNDVGDMGVRFDERPVRFGGRPQVGSVGRGE
ncbi:hypothetical protein BD626DRAFT_514146 [Schizophyllum amplum]|uniref:Uncharacterized protein n=1 Tax=Schizophyllum amplum TaxID=97359 RepID=A0A550BYN0_9AGAR|nr:hypothetical protein BD626DRAFT_514146 [Auriculariopsis ampla]